MKHLTVWVFLLLGMMGFGCSGEKKIEPIGDQIFGIWANENSELVRTSKYFLLFQRYDDNIAATVQRIYIYEDTLIYNSRAAVIFDTLQKTTIMRAKDLLTGEDLLVNTDQEETFHLTDYACIMHNYADSIVMTFQDAVLEVFYKKDHTLKFRAPDGTWQNLKKIEDIVPTHPYEMAKLSEENVGECLQAWSLGVGTIRSGQGITFGIPINTNRHSYLFAFAPYEKQLNIYCRAGRIRSSNSGTVLDPNILLIQSGETFITAMPDDNLEESRSDIIINDSLFIPDTANKVGDTEYWSLKALEDSVITLNGQGQFYYYTAPTAASENPLEWFEYIEYEKAGM